MLEGQIRRLMKRMEELENERRREEDWRMAQVRWLSEMDKGMWLGGDGRNDRERWKGGERMASMSCWREEFASWWIELKDQKGDQENRRRRGETRDLLRKEMREVRSGDGMAGIGGTR